MKDNLEQLSDIQLEEKINSMTHQMHKINCYSQQHVLYKNLQPVWDEYRRRQER